jgi:hypothetical protein
MIDMRSPPTLQSRPTDLTADDLRALTGSVESLTGYWRIKVTRAPGPDAGSGATRWAYLYWAGPPSEDIVPQVAVTRDRKGYRIFILDPLELFASGMFEAKDCGDLARALEVVLEVINEARETALDRSGPDVTTLASLLATRKPRESAEIRELILATMPTGILNS